MVIKVLEVVGSLCMLREEGEQLRQAILPELEACRPVTVDFNGVRRLLPGFLNVAIGSLYGQFSADFLARHLHFEGLDEIDAKMWENIQERAIWYFALTEERRAAVSAAALNAVESV